MGYRPQLPPRGLLVSPPCSLLRIDPASNRVVGRPIRLPGYPWDLAVASGSVWVTDSEGNVIRVDTRTGRVTARISARPIYLGGEIASGGGGEVVRIEPQRVRARRLPRLVARRARAKLDGAQRGGGAR